MRLVLACPPHLIEHVRLRAISPALSWRRLQVELENSCDMDKLLILVPRPWGLTGRRRGLREPLVEEGGKEVSQVGVLLSAGKLAVHVGDRNVVAVHFKPSNEAFPSQILGEERAK